ncbi:pentapeptide repeat-containing protein [Halopseudomonas xiamenensis]|uniref:pentapeptide repeat-containing protein n=1 Tax=Halopseudomonas xiamenensis TaxID=157792 RepID=UPI001624F656|nr:pentapeptide repeat-containing protein [Halopseudomonas xiamenensis]
MNDIASNQQYFDQMFDRQDLSSTEIRESVFEECEFSDCDLSATILTRCKFVDCTFKRCNLSLMVISQSRFSTAEFIECKLVGVDWTRAHWPSFDLEPGLAFRSCILNDSSFFGLTLHGLQLQDCRLHDVDFREGNFSGSAMRDCEFNNSVFMRTDLSKVDFSGSTDFTIDVLVNRITKARFSRVEALILLDSLGIELVD